MIKKSPRKLKKALDKQKEAWYNKVIKGKGNERMNGWDMGYNRQDEDIEYEWVMDQSMCLKKVPKYPEREITYVDRNQDIVTKKVRAKKIKKTY